jgi:hypothetical protein
MKKINLIILTIIICFLVILLSNKLIDININYEKEFTIIIFIILSIIRFRQNKNIMNQLKKDFQNNEFIVYIIIILSLMINSYLQKNIYKKNSDNYSIYKKKFESYKQAFIALILAYSGRLDIIFIPFFLVYIFNYYYE